MADTVPITAGSGTTVATDEVTIATVAQHAQLVKILDATDGSTNRWLINADGSATFVGNVASGSADSGAPVKVGGVQRTTAPTLTDGQRGDLQVDTRANVKASLWGPNATSAIAASVPADTLSGGTGLRVNSQNLVYNGATYDLLRGDITNGVDVDVTRLPALVAGSAAVGSLTDQVANGTISANGATVVVNLNGASIVMMQLSGAWTQTTPANVPVVEGTVDATNWLPLSVLPVSQSATLLSGSPYATGQIPTATVGIFQIDASGLASVRIRLPAALTTGTLTAYLRGSLGVPPDIDVATGQGHDLRFAVISAAASGNNTLVAAVGAGLKIKVVSYVMVADGTVTTTFQSGAGGTGLSGAMALVANSGVSAIGQASTHLFETAANTLLNLSLSAAIGVRGHLSYIVEP